MAGPAMGVATHELQIPTNGTAAPAMTSEPQCHNPFRSHSVDHKVIAPVTGTAVTVLPFMSIFQVP